MSDRYSIAVSDVVDWCNRYDGPPFHAILCDPPYGLGFMGQAWDGCVPDASVWSALRRHLLPGAHVLAFGGTRTFHRLAVAMEDAGLELRDTVCWNYGTGFPKSLNLSGAHAGYGSALKPAWEPCLVFRNPFPGTLAANCAEHGAGALNIDGTRIETGPGDYDHPGAETAAPYIRLRGGFAFHQTNPAQRPPHVGGRWPANVAMDADAAAMLDAQSGDIIGGYRANPSVAISDGVTGWNDGPRGERGYADTGGASRFFYCASDDPPTCGLCGMPYTARHGIMNGTQEPRLCCAKSADASSRQPSERADSVPTDAQHEPPQGSADKSGEWSSLVASAVSSLRSSLETEGRTAQATALLRRVDATARNAKSAASLCDKCAIASAAGLVAASMTVDGPSQSRALPACLDCMPNSSASILTRSLASFVALLGNTDTIPTTDSLCLLFGSVQAAIAGITNLGRGAEKASTASGQTRFRYVPKSDRVEREAGCDGLPETTAADVTGRDEGSAGLNNPRASSRRAGAIRNHHPCAKPVDLCRWLATMILPPREYRPRRLLVPFSGSGSEMIGAMLAGWDEIVGVELSTEYTAIAKARLEHWSAERVAVDGEVAERTEPAQLALFGGGDHA